MLKKIVNIAGLVVGGLMVIVAIPNTLKGAALLVGGLVLLAANIYWYFVRRRADRERLAKGVSHAAAND